MCILMNYPTPVNTISSYTMGCPPVHEDNPRAVQAGNPWYNYFIPPTYISVDLAQHGLFRARVDKGSLIQL